MLQVSIFILNLSTLSLIQYQKINIHNLLKFKPKYHIIKETIYWQKACMRKSYPRALTKGEVQATNKKPFVQKGRGMARQGSLKNPHQRGGGVAFPPKHKSYAYRINKKKKKISLKSIFFIRLKEQRIIVVKDIIFEYPSSKLICHLLKRFNWINMLLIDIQNKNLKLSTKNILKVKFIELSSINTFDFLKYSNILITLAVFNKILDFY